MHKKSFVSVYGGETTAELLKHVLHVLLLVVVFYRSSWIFTLEDV